MTSLSYADLQVGMTAEERRVCRADDLYVFANASGNYNPMNLPADEGAPETVAPSMWVAALISAVLGCRLPGPGTLYLSQSLEFVGRAHAGEELTAGVKLVEKLDGNRVKFDTWVDGSQGRIVEGQAVVLAPATSGTVERGDIPGLTVQRHVHFDRLLRMAEKLPPIPTAVVCPESHDALSGPLLAADHTLIDPILIGDPARIRAAAEAAELDISAFRIVEAADHRDAAARAVAMVHEGTAAAVMKGDLHTDILLGQVVKSTGGLRVGRRLSHVFVMDVPGLPHLLMVTDAAINIAPDLLTKADIIQNAIDLAHALGVDEPRVGVLSAVEVVNPAIPSTLDAAILSKMAERGQITGGLVDGPLAMDNAIDLDAARIKGIQSSVAGRADILVAPNLEAGNMVAKELTFLAHAEAGGIVIGAKCPIILTSRADNEKARLASAAIAALYAAHKAGGRK
ncbi:bifunctional enoyl-CoA hydratase/phosphate acetyltransferase [Chachezhania sediminis]|uniref:bifunctional enoyl-CoA hydratase/phosphate acetyltransferase n=1 Tax=Chachezhania sediminis TaxID=2599291 RepID=UPI001E4128BA|nr:bifunctional enoyl-CoA hydratase/phosphate acetyltransferase [Chachezhania sediminis]